MQLYKPIPNLVHVIKLDERKFHDKYMKNRPYATRLLEIYSGKSADHMIKSPLLQDSLFSELYSSYHLKRLDYLEKAIIIQFRLGP